MVEKWIFNGFHFDKGSEFNKMWNESSIRDINQQNK